MSCGIWVTFSGILFLKYHKGNGFPCATFSAKLCASRLSKYFGSVKIVSFSLDSDVDDIEGVVKNGLSLPLEKEAVVDDIDC